MTTAFARRFQLIVDQVAKGSKKQFAEITGKSASHIYKICRGSSRPSMAYLQYLYDEFKVDLTWLLTGEASHSAQPEGTSPNKDLVFAPIYDIQASAGFGSFNNDEEIINNFPFNKHWLSSTLRLSSEQLAFVTVDGDSMQPTLDDGDMVLVDMSQQQVRNEGIYLLRNDDSLLVKRIKTGKGKELSVISDNSLYSSWSITNENSHEHSISGRVVWYGRKL